MTAVRIDDREWPEGTEPYEPDIRWVGPDYVGLRLVSDHSDEVAVIATPSSPWIRCPRCGRLRSPTAPGCCGGSASRCPTAAPAWPHKEPLGWDEHRRGCVLPKDHEGDCYPPASPPAAEPWVMSEER